VRMTGVGSMFNFIAKRKENNESIGKIQLILEKLQLQEEFQNEQWSIQRENYQKLLARQRKNENCSRRYT